MTTRGDAITKALETTTTPGRRNIIDILTTSDTTCTACQGEGGQPRAWDTPHGQARGWYCDDCEIRARLALSLLKTGRLTKAIQVIEGIAS